MYQVVLQCMYTVGSCTHYMYISKLVYTVCTVLVHVHSGVSVYLA